MPNVLEVSIARRRRPTQKLAAAANRAAQDMLVQELQGLESRAHGMGLHVTGHALNRAKNALGWEIAGDIKQAGKASFALASR